MFKNEQFPLNNHFHELTVDSKIEELVTYLNKEQAVLVAVGSQYCLFIPEDLGLIRNNTEMNIGAFVQANEHLMSAILPYDETHLLDILLLHIPLTTNRPLLIQDSGGSIRGFAYLSALLHYSIREQQRWSAYFSTLARTVTDAVTVVDRNGEVICWNPIAEELYNLPQADILGRRIGEHFETETLMVLKILDEGRMIRNTYHRPRPDTHVLINASPIRDVQGHIIGGIATEQDITQLVRLNEQLTASHTFEPHHKPNTEDLFSFIKGKGPAIGKVVQWAKKVAATETPVLLIGETGVGKEQLAQIIHNASPRSEQLFLSVNCGIVPAGLLETELFGFQGGAFTGNQSGQAGKLEQAKDGTLFINEIDRLPLDLQAKLYDYISQQTIIRTGGNTPIAVRTRIIAASTQDLSVLVQNHEFRSDLYYALHVISIRIPPLRERIEDIPAMVHMYLKQFSLQYQKPLPTLSPEVILAFTNYDWPGNLQELRNVVERCVILSDEDMITLDHLPPSLQERQPSLLYPETEEMLSSSDKALKPKISEQDEIGMIEEALAKTAGNKSAAAKLLGISRGTLYNKMKEYEME
ncbi:sigma-54 interaction domain-containing protein [Paenibacillus sedimenti]|uniref:Sigma 54-interacting transcriptional regulator n=1 Tax=Paenibacillus sedimenti TaxID=2770274 RepID=A0A926KJG8_9BACL|nr:sigma 54-interacting transcriptional regulator [Paenibacillus sedimenti]MBD0378887.1 sigma 54-interacting transcriptional regulator [Paenibacillus sedimenti]